MRNNIVFWFLFGLFLLGSSFAEAGMLIVQQSPSGEELTWACEGAKFRMGNKEVYTIMDTDGQRIYTVMVKEREYTVSTAAEVRRQMEEMQKQLSRLKTLEKKFKGLGKLFGGKKEEKPQGSSSLGPKVTYKPTGDKEHIAGYKALKVLQLEDGHPVAELWVSEALAKDISQACDYSKLEAMIKAMTPEGQQMAVYEKGRPRLGPFKGEGISGFPVKVVDMAQGKETLRLIKAEKKRLSASYFKVPEGFKRLEVGKSGASPF